jgi:hypothetical protein
MPRSTHFEYARTGRHVCAALCQGLQGKIHRSLWWTPETHMDKLLQANELPLEIQQLLEAIAAQHRLMVEMEENLHQLEHDLAAARHIKEPDEVEEYRKHHGNGRRKS